MHFVNGSDSTSVEHRLPVREVRVRVSPPVSSWSYAQKMQISFLLIEDLNGTSPHALDMH